MADGREQQDHGGDFQHTARHDANQDRRADTGQQDHAVQEPQGTPGRLVGQSGVDDGHQHGVDAEEPHDGTLSAPALCPAGGDQSHQGQHARSASPATRGRRRRRHQNRMRK